MPKAIVSVIIVLSAVALQAQQAPRPCELVSWKGVQEKSRDSSLNGTYYYLAEDEGLSRLAQGLISYTSALDIETEMNITSICNTLELQQAELDELKAEVATLRKQLTQANRSANRNTANNKK